MPNPWEIDWSQGAPQGGATLVPLPDRTPKTSYRTLSPKEAQERGLPAGGVYQISSEGNISTAASPKDADASFKPTEFQSKSAGFLGRMVRANTAWGAIADTDKGPRGIIRQWVHESHPDLENKFINSDPRQAADQNERDFIAATLRQESGAAINASEFDKQYRIFFPMPGDGPQVLAQKAKAREQAIQGFRVAAGPLGAQVLANMGKDQQQINAPLPAQSVPMPPQGGAAPSAPNGPPGLSFDPNGNAILQDRSGGLAVGNDTGAVGLDGQYHSEANPKMAGANAEINDLLKRGAPLGAIAASLRNRGADPQNAMGILKQAQAIKLWQKQNPGYKGDFNIDVERVQVPNSGWQNFANSDVGAGLASAVDAATGFNSDSIIGALGGDSEDQRLAMAASQAAHPSSSTVGTLAGGVGSALGLEGLAGRAGLTGLARTGAADLTYGAGAGAGATDYAEDGSPASVGDRLTGAGKGALAATVGGLVGQGIAATGRGLARSSRDPYVAHLNADQVPLTVGQQYTGKLGGIIKRTEDRIAGLPLIGDIINARRAEGISKWNERVFDRALEPIGVKIEGRVGEAGVDYAQDKISGAFNKALKGKAVTADPQFSSELTAAVTKTASLPRVGSEVASGVQEILQPYMVGKQLSGESMQQISRELRDLKAGYRTDPMKKRIGDAIDSVEEAIFGPFKRQAPEVLPAYNKAKLAQRRLYTIADAVNAAKNKEGIFMPSQLGTADRNATKRMEGAVAAARGRGQFHDIQRSAQQVLPSSIPDSGTAGRILIPGIALGVGGTSDASGVTNGAGTTLAGILALAYSRAGQRLLTKPGRGLNGRAAKVLQSETTRKLLTGAGASGGVGLATQ